MADTGQSYTTFLREAAVLLGDRRLRGLAGRYDALGQAWRELAVAALPGEVPLLGETRALLDRRDAAYAAEGTDATDQLLGGLQARLVAIYADEVAARDELRAILG